MIAQEFPNAPDMIGQATGHGGREQHLSPFALSKGFSSAQLMMRPAEIVRTAKQPHAAFQRRQPTRGMPTFARQAGESLAHGLGKDTARRVLFRAYVSASSPPNPACKLSLHQALHHPSPAQLSSGISLCFVGCVLLYVL